MEIGKHSLSTLRDIIEFEDLAMNTKGGFIINAKLGTLIALRDSLRKQNVNVVYVTVSEQQLYLVHWNDLSEEKQKGIEKKRGVVKMEQSKQEQPKVTETRKSLSFAEQANPMYETNGVI